jgi:hypothetical protein
MVSNRKSGKRMSRKNMHRGGDWITDGNKWLSSDDKESLAIDYTNMHILRITEELVEEKNWESDDFYEELRNKIKEHADKLTDETCNEIKQTFRKYQMRFLFNDYFPLFNKKESNSVRGAMPGQILYNLETREPIEMYNHIVRLASIADGNDPEPFPEEKTQDSYEILIKKILEHVLEQSGWPEKEEDITTEWAEIAEKTFLDYQNEYNNDSDTEYMDSLIFTCQNLSLMSKYFDEWIELNDKEFVELIDELVKKNQKKKGGNRRRRISRRRY